MDTLDYEALWKRERETLRKYAPLINGREQIIVEKDQCVECGGSGIKSYSDTSTWRGGIGGQCFTDDVCDQCWGSGRASKPWPSHRSLNNG